MYRPEGHSLLGMCANSLAKAGRQLESAPAVLLSWRVTCLEHSDGTNLGSLRLLLIVQLFSVLACHP